jgi:hypothetical protein
MALIDRLSDPKRFLETIHERLNLGGVLVITSPYTRLGEFTKKENWLGGFRRGGDPYLTLDALLNGYTCGVGRARHPLDKWNHIARFGDGNTGCIDYADAHHGRRAARVAAGRPVA